MPVTPNSNGYVVECNMCLKSNFFPAKDENELEQILAYYGYSIEKKWGRKIVKCNRCE